ncbi:MAG: hypothetical protein GMKNLPBB_00874 [Myxococcota bacterium]|nr:hypothetical protein [Myxococcota bacterium]
MHIHASPLSGLEYGEMAGLVLHRGCGLGGHGSTPWPPAGPRAAEALLSAACSAEMGDPFTKAAGIINLRLRTLHVPPCYFVG